MTPDTVERLLGEAPLPDPSEELEKRVRRAAARRRSRPAWAARLAGPLATAAAALFFAGILWVSLETPERMPDVDPRSERFTSDPQDSKPVRDLIEGLGQQWQAIEKSRREGNVWVDKKDFSIAYEKWKSASRPAAATLREAEQSAKAWFERRKDEPGVAWRIRLLLSDMAFDRGDAEAAGREVDEAIAAYPDTSYADPSKLSKFQHLVNRRAMLIADARGPDAAIDYAARMAEGDRRLRYFYLLPWTQRFQGEEGGRALEALVARLDAAFEARSSDDPAVLKSWKEARGQLPALAAQRGEPADVPSQDLRARGDAQKRYFLIGPARGAKVPAEGFGLVLVLPGGDGSDRFQPFVNRIWKDGWGEGYLAAQLVAVEWQPGQFNRIVWPTEKVTVPGMKFSTEDFVEAVVEDAAKRHRINRARIFTLSWSSGGPAAYAVSLHPKTPVTGSFVAMSVFFPANLPPLAAAKGRAYYLLQSPTDNVTRFELAEAAERALKENGAAVQLKTYDGGHGWHGDVYGAIRAGREWLEKNARPAGK